MDKSILEAVHDAASDLNKAGLVNEQTMKEFDVLCLPTKKHKQPKTLKHQKDEQ